MFSDNACKNAFAQNPGKHRQFQLLENWFSFDIYPTGMERQIGLRVQLGHPIGESCINPKVAPGDGFVVIDVNGIHEVGVNFCECHQMEDYPKQLLQARWFPATVSSPQTAATFNVPEYFQLLTFESKASVFEFLNSLARRTDNTD